MTKKLKTAVYPPFLCGSKAENKIFEGFLDYIERHFERYFERYLSVISGTCRGAFLRCICETFRGVFLKKFKEAKTDRIGSENATNLFWTSKEKQLDLGAKNITAASGTCNGKRRDVDMKRRRVECQKGILRWRNCAMPNFWLEKRAIDGEMGRILSENGNQPLTLYFVFHIIYLILF